jgi:hypothetical protein
MASTATPNMRMALPAEGNHPPLGLAPHDVRMAPAADGIPNILPPAAVQGGGRAPLPLHLQILKEQLMWSRRYFLCIRKTTYW